MERTCRSMGGVIVLAMLAMVWGAEGRARGDAQSEYDKTWGAREQQTKTSGERAALANDLMDAADQIISGGKKSGKKDAGKPPAGLESLAGPKREEVILLCRKAHEIGCRQRESYAPAARALGVLQALCPDTRLDCLIKLQKMYEDAYQIAPSRNLGIAKGLAMVCLQVGEEEWVQWQRRQAKGRVPPADQLTAIRAISASYARGLDVVRSAMSAIKPYAAGNKAYQEFLNSSADVEKELVEAQKTMVGPLAMATEADKAGRNQAVMQTRLAANSNDTLAADRLVRLCINELDDPKGVEKVLRQASAGVQEAVGLMKKPVGQLTTAEAWAVAQWCERNNDNPASPNVVAMDIRTRVYCEAYQKAAGTKDANGPQADALVKKVSADLARAQMSEEQVKSLAMAYVAALEPASAVAKVTRKETAPEKKVEPAVVAEKPAVAAPVEEREITSIKVQPAVTNPREMETANRDTSIFNFGRD